MPKPVCPFGAKCYRKNPKHLEEFHHPPPSTAGAAVAAPAAKPPPTPVSVVPLAASALACSPASSPGTARTTKLTCKGGVFVRVAVESDEVKSAQECAPTPSPHVVESTLPSSPKAPAASPLAPSPKKRNRDSDTDEASDAGLISSSSWAAVLSLPPARPSPLGITSPAVSLFDVYEMPFPLEEMNSIIAAAKALRPDAPLLAFPGWRLVGPFEVLLGTLTFATDADKWRYARFRYDPPEVQTVAVSHCPSGGAAEQQHLAYHRDDPLQLPTMVVRGSAKSPTFEVMCETLVRTLLGLLHDGKHVAQHKALQSAVPSTALGMDSAAMLKARRKVSIVGTLHRLGVVVPYDKKSEVGYRPPMHTQQQLKTMVVAWNQGKILPKQLDELNEQFQWADIANDECDFGLNLELGINLFSLCYSRNDVLWHTWRILETVYSLLNRELYRHILKCHLLVLAGEVKPLGV